jgi:hypothetical protein
VWCVQDGVPEELLRHSLNQREADEDEEASPNRSARGKRLGSPTPMCPLDIELEQGDCSARLKRAFQRHAVFGEGDAAKVRHQLERRADGAEKRPFPQGSASLHVASFTYFPSLHLFLTYHSLLTALLASP